MKEIKDLVEISKYAGERFDLVQAGGGNSSIKLQNGEMLIKASGFSLSDVEKEHGFSRVSTKKIASIVTDKQITNENKKRKRESIAAKLVQKATIDKTYRPSIETLLHSFLDKYTLHTHPIAVNMILIQKNYEELLGSIFKNEDIAMVQYRTPGIELAIELNKVLLASKTKPKIIFLQNHGLIVTSPNKKDIKVLTEKVLNKIEAYLKINLNNYKLTNNISYLVNKLQKTSYVSLLSEDKYLNAQLNFNKKLFFQTPFCPDSLVFCGVSAIEIDHLLDKAQLENFKEKYFEFPKVIIFDKKLFFVAQNIKKAKEMEEVLKFHIMVLEKSLVKNNNNFLPEEELAYLNNWEAEKYRQKL